VLSQFVTMSNKRRLWGGDLNPANNHAILYKCLSEMKTMVSMKVVRGHTAHPSSLVLEVTVGMLSHPHHTVAHNGAVVKLSWELLDL